MKAGNPERIIFNTFLYKSVRVKIETSSALEEVGDVLSPTYTPEIIAPATGTRETPPAFAIVINTIPIVPTEPNEVPKAKETTLDNKKQNNRNNGGCIHFNP
jgi:hypothetical protein